MFWTEGTTERPSVGQIIQISFACKLSFTYVVEFSAQAREKETEDNQRQLETCKRTFDYLEQKMQSEIKLLRKSNTVLLHVIS